MNLKVKLSMPRLTFRPKHMLKMLARYHTTYFIVFVVACLGAAVITANSIINDTTVDDNYVSPIGAGSIDQATLDRIKSLHTSNENSPLLKVPNGRINPFAE